MLKRTGARCPASLVVETTTTTASKGQERNALFGPAAFVAYRMKAIIFRPLDAFEKLDLILENVIFWPLLREHSNNRNTRTTTAVILLPCPTGSVVLLPLPNARRNVLSGRFKDCRQGSTRSGGRKFPGRRSKAGMSQTLNHHQADDTSWCTVFAMMKN